MRSIIGMLSDDMPPRESEGAIHLGRKADAKHHWNAFRRYAAEGKRVVYLDKEG